MVTPEITVLVPVYNGRRFLRTAVESVLAEAMPEVEVVVIDDGSTDDSIDTVADLDVRVVVLPENRGIARALNRGLREAKGTWITVLDSDDVMVQGGLRWRAEYVRERPEVVAVGGRPAGIIDEEGRLLGDVRHLLTPGYEPPPTLTLDFFRTGAAYPVTMWLYLFRRSLLEQLGGFDETFESTFDMDLLFRVLVSHSIPIEFRPTVLRRWHDDNHSLTVVDGTRALKPRTVREVVRLCERYGVETGADFPLWETGYR